MAEKDNNNEKKSTKLGQIFNAHGHTLVLQAYLGGFTVALDVKKAESDEGKRGYKYDRVGYAYLSGIDLGKLRNLFRYMMKGKLIAKKLYDNGSFPVEFVTAGGDKIGFAIGDGKVSLVSMNSKGSGIDFEFTAMKIQSKLSDEDERDLMMTSLLLSIEEFYNKITDVLEYKNPKYIEHVNALREQNGNGYNRNNNSNGSSNRSYQDSSDAYYDA